MKRRHLLRYGALSATTASLAACTSSAPSGPNTGDLPRLDWQMPTSWPTSLDTLYGTTQFLADRVKAMSGGRFSIRTFAAGELVPGLQVLDAVQSGTVPCGHSPSYYYTGKNSAFAFGTSIPFGLTAQQQNAWLYEGGGLDLMNKIYADFNIIAFPAGNTGVQMGGWFKREVNTVRDLQGLKMRIPGLGGKVLDRLGVNTQVLPGGEVYLALERGAIDAAEWVGPYDDEKLGLNDAAQFYYYPGFWEPGPTMNFMVNLDAWNQLPPAYQDILETACAEANQHCLALYDALNPQALTRLINTGTQLKPFSSEILTACQRETQALLEEEAAANSQFREIYDQWSQFRQAIYQWHKVGELSFNNFVTQ